TCPPSGRARTTRRRRCVACPRATPAAARTGSTRTSRSRPTRSSLSRVELRDLPSVDELARGSDDPLAVDAARAVLARAREEIRAGAEPGDLTARLREELHAARAPRLRRVLNATGVIVHTNLGRAPLAEEALPRLDELAAVARRHGLPLVDDLGSGVLAELPGEPSAAESLAAGAGLVCFSGDKLLGGPQAGIVVGRGELVERLRRHPLQRALRADKLTLAALEATLGLYLDPERAAREIPVLQMLAEPREAVRARAEQLAGRASRWAASLPRRRSRPRALRSQHGRRRDRRRPLPARDRRRRGRSAADARAPRDPAAARDPAWRRYGDEGGRRRAGAGRA